jgi:hypothetical protein
MPKLPEHFFIADNGDLYDTRKPHWHKGEPVRKNYSRQAGYLRNLHDIKAALRYGAFAWPGGYPLYFIMADGDLATFEGVLSEWKNVVADTMAGHRSCWVPVAVDANFETPGLYCSITGALIEAAYLSDEDQQELMS